MLQELARLAPRRMRGGLLRHRMPDVGHRNAGFFVERRLERKQREHAVDAVADRLPGARAATPTPTGSRSGSCARRRASACARGPRLKSGASTPTKSGTPRVEQARAKLAPDAEQLGQMREHFDEAAHGELLEREPGLAAGGLHARARDAGEAHVRAARAHGVDQRRGKRIARRLAGDDPDGDGAVPSARRACACLAASPHDAAAGAARNRERRQRRRRRRLGCDAWRARRRAGGPRDRASCTRGGSAEMSSASKPRRRKPSLLVPCGSRRIPLHRHVRRHVLQHDRERGEHRVRTDAAELVNAGERAQHRPIADVHMARRSARCWRTSCGCRSRNHARRAYRRGTGCRCRSACRRGPARCRHARSRIRGTRCRRRWSSWSARRRTCGPARSRRSTRTGRCDCARRCACGRRSRRAGR